MTTAKKTPGRPKKSPAKAAPVADAPVEQVKDDVVKYVEPQQKPRGAVFEAMKGGVVYLLPQRGITIFDEDKGQVREIRYCENMPSIYVDEQGDHARRGSIVFRDKNLIVSPRNPQLTEYMRAHPGNVDNGGNLFREHKPAIRKKRALESEFDIVEAVAAVRDKSISELLPVAMSYGISTDQQPSDIRYALLKHAKSNPTSFMSTFDNPMVKAAAVIRQATDFQILRKKEDGYYWFDSNGLIVACPVGQDPVDVLTRFCLTERGAPVLLEIKDRLSKMN